LGNAISSRLVRGKIHSSLGGRKAHLTFELKDAPKARRLRRGIWRNCQKPKTWR